MRLFADAGFGFDGADLFAEVAFSGAAGFAAASGGENGFALEVFEAEGEVAVEGDEADSAGENVGSRHRAPGGP